MPAAPGRPLRLEVFAEFEGWERLEARRRALPLQLPPRTLPPTRLAPGEQAGAVLRRSAKLFYEPQHEAEGHVEAALEQLAACGLAVVDRRPVSYTVPTRDGQGFKDVYFGDRVLLELRT